MPCPATSPVTQGLVAPGPVVRKPSVAAAGLVSTSEGSGFGQNGSTLKRGALLRSFATACFSGLQRPNPISNADTTAPRYTKRHFFMATSLWNGNERGPSKVGGEATLWRFELQVPTRYRMPTSASRNLRKRLPHQDSPDGHSFPSEPIGPRWGWTTQKRCPVGASITHHRFTNWTRLA